MFKNALSTIKYDYGNETNNNLVAKVVGHTCIKENVWR